jgi:SAM-dependent methyltransferase
MSDQQHQSDPRILDRRRLASDHRGLAARLAPDLSVLDVGCGTGAITSGIAEAVGSRGMVVGLDRDRALLARATEQWASVANLSFEVGDATSLDYDARFDVVTAARTLQWIADLPAAIRRMERAAKPGGLLVVLDFDHTQHAWEPLPPPAFTTFFDAFLSWRTASGWDNAIATRLPALLAAAGLEDVRSENHDETTRRGEPDFLAKTALWAEVIESLGPTLERAGACDAAGLDAARRDYDAYRRRDLLRHTLSMRTVVARVPARRP